MGCVSSEDDHKPRIPGEVISLQGKPGMIQKRPDERGEEAKHGWNFRASPRLGLIPWGVLEHNAQHTGVGLLYSHICQRLTMDLLWEI